MWRCIVDSSFCVLCGVLCKALSSGAAGANVVSIPQITKGDNLTIFILKVAYRNTQCADRGFFTVYQNY